MAQILGFRVQNFRVLRDVTLGKLWNTKQLPLSSLVAVIGKNGSGKSTLFDAFGFLRDALQVGVEEACDLKQRGGYGRLVSAGGTGPIRFELYYRETLKDRPITYELSIAADTKGRPFVEQERLRQRRKGQATGRPYSFLRIDSGKGKVWSGEETSTNALDDSDNVEEPSSENIEFFDARQLAISTLGVLKSHPRIAKFRQFLESWYLSYFTPDAARSLPLAGPQKHLSVHGDNIGNVVQYMQREHHERFREVLKKIASRIPGIRQIEPVPMQDGRLLLRFNDEGFQDPFLIQQVSDGTIKMFAYLLLLEDPEPPPFLCIEEPENGLYHQLLETLAMEFRQHPNRTRRGSQVFVTTHQPYFVNALEPREVWLIKKNASGFSEVRQASAIPTVEGLVDEGVELGALWYSNYLE